MPDSDLIESPCQGNDLFEQAAATAALSELEARNRRPIDEAVADARLALTRLPEEVTADVILPDIARYAFTDPRAVGNVMKRLLKAGAIRATDRVRASGRRGNHGAPRRVYLNLERI